MQNKFIIVIIREIWRLELGHGVSLGWLRFGGILIFYFLLSKSD